MGMISGFSVKSCHKISYYIFDIENIAGQYYLSIKFISRHV